MDRSLGAIEKTKSAEKEKESVEVDNYENKKPGSKEESQSKVGTNDGQDEKKQRKNDQPSKICRNGPECEFLKQSRCWFTHPEKHRDKQSRTEHSKQSVMKPNTFEEDEDMESFNESHFNFNLQKPFFGVTNTMPTAKNWEMGMQETMHSLEKRIERRMEMQMNQITQEIKQIQNKMK